MMTLNYENTYKSSIDMAVMEANPHKTGTFIFSGTSQMDQKRWVDPQSKGAWVDELIQKG